MTETTEGNKLIAEFMEYPTKLTCKNVASDTLKYHISWDSLMPVVDKIGTIFFHRDYDPIDYRWQDDYSLAYLLDSIGNKTSRTYLINDIKTVWFATVEFLEWYNKEKEY